MKLSNRSFRTSMSIAVILALLTVTVALAASGDLDTTFSGDGKIIQSFGGTQHRGWNVAVQTDGKIVVVGEKWLGDGSNRDFVIARYNTNGTLDTAFSGDGRQVVSVGAMDQAVGVAIQTDGKIVVGGQTCNAEGTICDVALVRLTSNGALDTTFSGDGKVTTDFASGDNGGFDLALLGGKIVVVGYLHDGASYNAAVYQYLPSGALDTTFSDDGILSINFGMDDSFNGVAVYSGKIYAAGWGIPAGDTAGDFITARINSNGSLDTTFSGDGKIRTNLGGNDQGREIAVSGGKVVVVGFSDTNAVILRFTASGVLDTTFSGDGKVITNLGLPSPALRGVTIQNGKIVVVGVTDAASGISDGLIARFTPAGNLDTTFSADGIMFTNWGGSDYYRSVVFKNARLYVVGESVTASDVRRFIIAAYQP